MMAVTPFIASARDLCGWIPAPARSRNAAGRATTWSCKIVPDERVALESEIGRLQRDNAALKKSLLASGMELPNGVMAEAPAAPGPVPPGSVPDLSAKAPERAEPRPISIAPSRS